MYEIICKNPYFLIGTKFTTNWDGSWFYVDKLPMTMEQIKYFDYNSEVIKRVSNND